METFSLIWTQEKTFPVFAILCEKRISARIFYVPLHRTKAKSGAQNAESITLRNRWRWFERLKNATEYQRFIRYWRAPGGSLKEKPKGDKKKTSPTKSIFCGTFFIVFWLPWPPRKGHWQTKISALFVPPTKFFKKGYDLSENGEMLSRFGDPAFISLWVNKSSFVT